MRRFISALAIAGLAVTLSGCEWLKTASKVSTVAAMPVGEQTVNDARNIAFALKSLYTAALPWSIIYIERPPCALPKAPPLCSTTSVVIAADKAQRDTSAAINRLEKLVLETNPDTKLLPAAIAAARTAWAGYQEIIVINGMGGK